MNSMIRWHDRIKFTFKEGEEELFYIIPSMINKGRKFCLIEFGVFINQLRMRGDNVLCC